MSEVNYSNYSISNVFRNTFKVMKENTNLYSIIFVILTGFYALPNFLFDTSANSHSNGLDALILIYGIISGIFYLGLYVVIVDNSFGTLSNKQYEGGPYLQRVLSVILPLIGLCIVMGIFIGIGVVLLIIPGIYLMLKYYLAFPVKIIENRSIFNSLSRSGELTNGHKISILLTVLIVLVVIFIISFGMLAMVLSPVVQSGNGEISISPVYIIFSSAFNAFVFIFGTIMPTAIYCELTEKVTDNL